mmetsp:Transcript_12870/g.37787  ORF Transcript_12870/g.37787 Transcript_12870/m.37787 type:complete len:211 (+) Transcript_12870:820-1452(+)
MACILLEMFFRRGGKWDHSASAAALEAASADAAAPEEVRFAAMPDADDAELAPRSNFGLPDPTPPCLASFFHFFTRALALAATSALSCDFILDTAAPTNVSERILRLTSASSRRCNMSRARSASSEDFDSESFSCRTVVMVDDDMFLLPENLTALRMFGCNIWKKSDAVPYCWPCLAHDEARCKVRSFGSPLRGEQKRCSCSAWYRYLFD